MPGAEGTVRLEAELPSGRVLLRETRNPVLDPMLRPVPGSAVLAATWTERSASGEQAFYALSLDGRSFYPPKPTTYDLKLRRAEFDPLRGEPAVAATLAAQPDRSDAAYCAA